MLPGYHRPVLIVNLNRQKKKNLKKKDRKVRGHFRELEGENGRKMEKR
jgi:hypothetical protein